MSPKISVITPACRGAETLSRLLNDFKNQIFQDFEHVVVFDGQPPKEVKELFKNHRSEHKTYFHQIKKDPGDMKKAPGTKPRNFGIAHATGEYCVFADDDDRYKDSYLASLIDGTEKNTISCVQMTCSEARMMTNGDPKVIRLVPELWIPKFPLMCHIGTPCLIVRKKWAADLPWQEEPEHDIRFFRRILEKYQPTVLLKSGMQVDVDGAVIGNMPDWVSRGPFDRAEKYGWYPSNIDRKEKYVMKEYPSNRIILDV